jgi:hypothetical protein
MEENIRPARGWIMLPLLILLIGWTCGVALASYLSPGIGLTVALGFSLIALFMVAIISRRRLQARKALGDEASYRRHLALRLGLALFILVSLFSFVISFTSTQGGQKFIKETYARFFSTNKNSNSQSSSSSPQKIGTQSPLPLRIGYVSDFAGIIDGPTKKRLEETLGDLKKRAGIDFAVVTTRSTEGQSIDDYSLAVARGWGVGGDEGGLLLLVALKEHEWRIQVSRKLQSDLPDDVVADYGRLMNEPFRGERYGEGIIRCVDAIIKRLAERRGFAKDKDRKS